MDEHIIYARVFGLFCLILSFGILGNLGHAKKMANEMIHDATGYIMGGVLPLIISSWLLITHNSWTFGWPLVITMIAWVLLGLAILRLWFVKSWLHLMERYYDKLPILFALFGLIFGMLMCYVGFVSPHLASDMMLP